MKRASSILVLPAVLVGIALLAPPSRADVSWGSLLPPASTTPGTTAVGGANAPPTAPERMPAPLAVDPDKGPNVVFENETADDAVAAVEDAAEKVVDKVKGDDDADEKADKAEKAEKAEQAEKAEKPESR